MRMMMITDDSDNTDRIECVLYMMLLSRLRRRCAYR